MRYELRLSAYDCLDQVNWIVRVGESSDSPDDKWEWDTIRAGHFPGEGQDGREQWVRDTLVQCLEAL